MYQILVGKSYKGEYSVECMYEHRNSHMVEITETHKGYSLSKEMLHSTQVDYMCDLKQLLGVYPKYPQRKVHGNLKEDLSGTGR